MKLAKHSVFPIKTYEQFDVDPLNVILNVFSKIKRDGEGAALQVVFQAPLSDYHKNTQRVFDQVQKGVPIKEALPKSVGEEVWSFAKDFAKDILTPSPVSTEDEKKKKESEKVVDSVLMENIKNKMSAPMAEINIRFVASAPTSVEAEKIILDLESAFHQFHNATGNEFQFEKISPRKLNSFTKDFTYRAFSEGEIMPLNFKELTTVFHFPGETITSHPQLHQAKAGAAAAPIDLPQSGTLLGVNRFRNTETKVYMTKEDRYGTTTPSVKPVPVRRHHSKI